MKKAFTLIELLIVVAIIAILAAIAVPNFLEAQVRAKVSRTKNDVRAQATGLEAYMVDWNSYPNCHNFGIALARDGALTGSPADPAGTMILERISTPIAYMSSALVKDPFKVSGARYSAANAQAIKALASPTAPDPSDPAAVQNSYIYQSWMSDGRYAFNQTAVTKATSWLLHSAGPDGVYYNLGGVLANDTEASLEYTIGFIYDSTNGTVSRGSIWRCGGNPGPGNATAAYAAAGQGLMKAISMQK